MFDQILSDSDGKIPIFEENKTINTSGKNNLPGNNQGFAIIRPPNEKTFFKEGIGRFINDTALNKYQLTLNELIDFYLNNDISSDNTDIVKGLLNSYCINPTIDSGISSDLKKELGLGIEGIIEEVKNILFFLLGDKENKEVLGSIFFFLIQFKEHIQDILQENSSLEEIIKHMSELSINEQYNFLKGFCIVLQRDASFDNITIKKVRGKDDNFHKDSLILSKFIGGRGSSIITDLLEHKNSKVSESILKDFVLRIFNNSSLYKNCKHLFKLDETTLENGHKQAKDTKDKLLNECSEDDKRKKLLVKANIPNRFPGLSTEEQREFLIKIYILCGNTIDPTKKTKDDYIMINNFFKEFVGINKDYVKNLFLKKNYRIKNKDFTTELAISLIEKTDTVGYYATNLGLTKDFLKIDRNNLAANNWFGNNTEFIKKEKSCNSLESDRDNLNTNNWFGTSEYLTLEPKEEKKAKAKTKKQTANSLPKRKKKVKKDADIEHNTIAPESMYLREIGKIKLLSREEEIVLSKKIQTGISAVKEFHSTILNIKGRKNEDKTKEQKKEEEEEGNLLIQIKARIKKAKDDFISANLKLSVSIAKKFMGRGLELSDLIQAGNIGLDKAVERFDPNKGFKFATYATWWVRQSITRAIADQGKTIRLPVHMIETINKFNKTYYKLAKELKREPSPSEIAEEHGIKVEEAEELIIIRKDTHSLDLPVGSDDGDTTLLDIIVDERTQTPEERVCENGIKEALNKILDTLSEKERKIVKLRFGIDNPQDYTLEEVGKMFAVTRERIRQIEALAIKKLKHRTQYNQENFL